MEDIFFDLQHRQGIVNYLQRRFNLIGMILKLMAPKSAMRL